MKKVKLLLTTSLIVVAIVLQFGIAKANVTMLNPSAPYQIYPIDNCEGPAHGFAVSLTEAINNAYMLDSESIQYMPENHCIDFNS